MDKVLAQAIEESKIERDGDTFFATSQSGSLRLCTLGDWVMVTVRTERGCASTMLPRDVYAALIATHALIG